MTTRRPRGTGTIRRTPNGRWRAMFAFQAGAREDIDGSPFATREEAERALDAVLAALHDAGAVRGGITLRRLGELALAQRDRDGYRAVEGDRSTWSLRMLNWELVGLPASSITRGDVREWLAGMRNKETKKPLARQTRANALNLLRAVYTYGVEHEHVTENPCLNLRVRDHGSTRETSTFLTLGEANALIRAATDPGVALAIGTGMRSGELRSLHWDDVHADHIVVRYGAPNMPPKNGRIRQVPLLPVAREALERLREAAAVGGDGAPTGVVLPTPTGTHRFKGKVFSRRDWRAWLAAAGITRRVRQHDLRHTAATLLLTGAWGRPWTYEEVKEFLGHSSVTVTERYARATGGLAARAALATPGAAPDRSGIGARPEEPIVSQAREIIESHLRDLNSRPTVYETDRRGIFSREISLLARLSRSYVEAVSAGSPHAHVRGLELADAVLDLAAHAGGGSARAANSATPEGPSRCAERVDTR